MESIKEKALGFAMKFADLVGTVEGVVDNVDDIIATARKIEAYLAESQAEYPMVFRNVPPTSTYPVHDPDTQKWVTR